MTTKIFKQEALLLLLCILIPSLAFATGPRITGTLFSTTGDEIYAVDNPPFISMEVAGGGIAAEIVNHVFVLTNREVQISTLPLQNMLHYYTSQTTSLAVIDYKDSYTHKQQKNLIFIPIIATFDTLFYNKKFYPEGFKWPSNINDLKGKRLADLKGEDADKYIKAGVKVEQGRPFSTLKQLVSGNADFMCLPELSQKWLTKKYFPQNLQNITTIEAPVKSRPLYIIFNTKHPDGKAAAKSFKKALSKLITDDDYLNTLKKYMSDKQAVRYTDEIKLLNKVK